MNIIQITANENGSRPPIQKWSRDVPPEGYAAVECDITAFYDASGFVTLTIENGVVTGMKANVVARDAYLATLPQDTDPQPTADEKIEALESENNLMSAKISTLVEQNDFQENLIVELANIVYA